MLTFIFDSESQAISDKFMWGYVEITVEKSVQTHTTQISIFIIENKSVGQWIQIPWIYISDIKCF